MNKNEAFATCLMFLFFTVWLLALTIYVLARVH